MRQSVLILLACVGTLWCVISGVRTGRDFIRDPRVRIILHDERGAPVRAAAIFVDRSDGVIERIVADSSGVTRLPFGAAERRSTRWLVCGAGYTPTVGWITNDDYEEDHLMERADEAKPIFIRRRGWLGPIPRECPQVSDSVAWLSSTTTDGPSRLDFSEPDLSRQP